MGYYTTLRDSRNYSEDLQRCIEDVVERLETATDPDSPGMLLGRIQSGKTGAFLGTIALAFDRGYEIAIVLTKGTKTLASQTVKRIGRDFRPFLDEDIVLFDIMSAPDPLTRSEQRRKIIIVAKKQVNNLDRIQEMFDEKYPQWKERPVLLVDDEADMASVRFSKKRGEKEFDQGAIANRMDKLRRTVPRMSFLQVTATPYALYLQPENYEGATIAREIFYPKRPTFTVLLPKHEAYVGGDDYFGGHGADDPRYYLYQEVEPQEHDALRSADGRTIREDRLWQSANVKMLRRSLMTFVLAVAVRQRQQKDIDERPLKRFAMVIHNDTQREAHKWQWKTVNKLIKAFETAAETDDERLKELFSLAYDDLARSLRADGGNMPSARDAFDDVKAMIVDGELNVQLVNSDVQLEPLLDAETAELRLRTKANVYIGGSILDRGITVPNLISFYYGRNPKRMQADTVLQHSRMYGARPKPDLAVTRFYTSRAVFTRLQQINALENALREAFENGANQDGVVFIQNDPRGAVIPCAPSKISLSDVVAVRPAEVLSPNGFDTIAQTSLSKHVAKTESLVPTVLRQTKTFVDISLETALQIIDTIEPTLVWPGRTDFDWDAMKGFLKYFAGKAGGEVKFMAQVGRELNKENSNDRSGLSILGSPELRDLVREQSRKGPALILLRQKGGEDLKWNAGPFWWPMLACPPSINPCVFATKVAV